MARRARTRLRGLLYQLFVELNHPLPAMGIKQWSAKLTEDQRSVLAALPLPTPDRESVVTATHLLGQAFTSHARQAQLTVGSEWPDQAGAAVAAYWTASGLTQKRGGTKPVKRRAHRQTSPTNITAQHHRPERHRVAPPTAHNQPPAERRRRPGSPFGFRNPPDLSSTRGCDLRLLTSVPVSASHYFVESSASASERGTGHRPGLRLAEIQSGRSYRSRTG